MYNFLSCKKKSIILQVLLIICTYNILLNFVNIFVNNNEKNHKNKYENRIKSFYVEAYNWNFLEKWKSINTNEKLEYKINYNIGLNIDAEIGDFGDYNSDVKTDLILFKYDKDKLLSTIFIYVFSVKENKFIYHTEVSFEGKIMNVTAIDLNFDGALDVLVLFKDNKDSSKSNKYYVAAFLQNDNDQLEEIWNSKKKEQNDESITDNEEDNIYYTNIHPLICDINNDGLPDIIGQQSGGPDGFFRFIWINTRNGFKSFLWKNINIFKYSELDEITNPNSSAIVDINGDCKSDLVFTVYNSYEKKNWFRNMVK